MVGKRKFLVSPAEMVQTPRLRVDGRAVVYIAVVCCSRAQNSREYGGTTVRKNSWKDLFGECYCQKNGENIFWE